jgi:DNA-binding MarR family transcriptional regulator
MPMSTPSPTTAPPLDGAEIAARLRLSATRLARILRQQADLGLTPSQVTALATVAREGPLTLGALADTEHVTPPSMTKVVERLEVLGLIERRHDPLDGRRVLAAVTPAGLAMLAEARARKDALLSTRIAELDGDELARLAAALDVLDRLAGTVTP